MNLRAWLDRRHPVLEYTALAASGLLYAIALKYFVFPAKVILTGFEGVAAALAYFFKSDSLFMILYGISQAILVGFAFKKISKTFAIRTALSVGMVLVALPLLPEMKMADAHDERLILVLFGGILSGLAKALALRLRGSTGDEDILGAWFAMKYLKPVGSIAVISAAISCVFGLVLEYFSSGKIEPVINTLMYTAIFIFTGAETLNNFFRKFKLVMITAFGKEPDKIGRAITKAAPHRTFTIQGGTGGYSAEPLHLVRTIVTHEELPEILDAIEQDCPEAFHIHHDIEGVSRSYYIKPIG
ncbi:YitT family protein [Luteolibacter sp. GHJ8]|uniref:YitT family protein n=1 Tax=Luteolibacter rhizosphaerae TaxID=2989719 RepID=A0ABT3G3F3_9BACT|nr:YitT family protein [Luteolibacter rhizosphaerae]MCW1914366.1 YitT family protein [Luteolibacter rhizosphaerae]